MNLRAVQRTLFRMQCDPSFAVRYFAGDAEAAASTGLDDRGRAVFAAVDAARASADLGGKRRMQVLSNLSAEFEISARLAEEGPAGAGVAAQFFTSTEFHDAIRFERSLPTAFGAYLARRVTAVGDAPAAAALAVEAALAAARRGPRTDFAPPPPGAATLAAEARLLFAASGVVAALERIKERPPSGPRASYRAVFDSVSTAEREAVLIVVGARPGAFATPAVRVERLEPLVASLLETACAPFDAAAARAFAAAHAIDVEDVASFVDELVGEGVLTRR